MSKNTISSIAGHLSYAFLPLKEAVSNLENFKIFCGRMGWDVTSLPQPYIDLADIVEDAVVAINSFSDNEEPDLKEIQNAFELIKSLWNAIKNLNSSPSGVNSTNFLNDIKDRLFDYLLIEYLKLKLPKLYRWLDFFGILDNEYIEATSSRPAYFKETIQYDLFPELIKNPSSLLQSTFGWKTDNFDFYKVAETIYQLLTALGINSNIVHNKNYELSSNPFKTSRRFVNINLFTVYIANNPHYLSLGIFKQEVINSGDYEGILIKPIFPLNISTTLPLTKSSSLSFRANANLVDEFRLVINPKYVFVDYPFNDSAQFPDSGFGLTYANNFPDNFFLLGKETGSNLSLKNLEVKFDVNVMNGEKEFIFELNLKGLALKIKAGEGDGFIQKVLGKVDKEITCDVSVIWSSKHGLTIKGNAGFEISVPTKIAIGPVTVDNIKLRIYSPQSNPAFAFAATADIQAEIGPLSLTIGDIGMDYRILFEEGNLGKFDMKLGFKPPTSVGLSIETSSVIGGGYLKIDPDNNRYAGVLELKVVDKVTIRVLGLLNTRLPGGKKGYSLLMLVFVEDFEPIALGYGFTLNGVGGLLGLNRTANTEKLRSAVRSDDLQSTLFPQDVVKNANHIISNLEQFYPASEGRFLVGPMAKIGWGAPKSFITVDLGIIIELPAPVTIVILGVIKAVLPDAEVPVAIIKLNINFLGVIDFGKKSISFDASLYDSTYYMLAVSGDMAFRLIWGDKPAFLLTVGGFNPQFTPPPLNLPDIRRLTVCLVDKPELKLKLETYLAITSNTVQTGARLIALAEEGGFTANAMFWFDVLIQFNPFYLIANVGASAVIRAGGTVLLTAYLDLTLTGPKPWTVRGRVEFKALFIKSCINVNARWGEEANPTIPNKPIWPELEAAINDVNNWLALLPKRNNISVSVKNVALAAGEVLIHPMGNFSFNQTILPMNATINKYGSVKPSDYKKFWVVSVKDANENALDFIYQKDNFAPAQYTQMSDQEKLSKKSFEQFDSGIKVGTEALKSSHWVKRDVSHEEKIIDRRMKPSVTSSRDVPLDLFNTMLLHGDVANAPQSPVKNRLPYDAPATSSVNTNQYKVAVKDTMVSYDSTTFDSIASANQYLNSVVNANQTQENKLFVVETCEL